ncbi:MAG TPA: hypothetical protein VK528_05335 [Flavobacterium sp.]|nr:hypothetical protein [Flavobacterium sp.]
MENLRSLFILSFLALLFSGCNHDSDYIDPRGTDYAGAESCIQCHQSAYHSALQNAHHKATAPASIENVMGSFMSHNTFAYDQNTKLVMEKRGDSLYQVLYENGKAVKAYRFDIVFGIKNAQTSVYWHNKNTYELPVSYYKSADAWATSPGFSATAPNFDRRVNKDCYECHSSNASNRIVTTNSAANSSSVFMDMDDAIDSKTIVYGIDCERCHGPAKKHVDYHLRFPDVKTAHDIASFKSLSNQQKLDACAICHSGNDHRLKIKPRFPFRPGDKLSDYYRNPLSGTTDYDVHGNQNGLLAQSKCFMESGTMNCTTCHNSHENKVSNLAAYSKVCISCHNNMSHAAPTIKTISENALKQNCIDCHMPKQSSKAIGFQLSNDAKLSSYQLRTHKIAIYPAKK